MKNIIRYKNILAPLFSFVVLLTVAGKANASTPVVSTNGVTYPTATSTVILHGTITSTGGSSIVPGFDVSFGTLVPATLTPSLISSTSAMPAHFSEKLLIECGSGGNVKAKATISGSTSTTFATAAAFVVPSCYAPIVSTGSSTVLTSTSTISAVIYGNLLSTGATGSSTVSIVPGFIAATFAGSYIPVGPVAPSLMTAPGTFSAHLSGLSCGSTYSYIAVANTTDDAGGFGSSWVTFKTPRCPGGGSVGSDTAATAMGATVKNNGNTGTQTQGSVVASSTIGTKATNDFAQKIASNTSSSLIGQSEKIPNTLAQASSSVSDVSNTVSIVPNVSVSLSTDGSCSVVVAGIKLSGSSNGLNGCKTDVSSNTNTALLKNVSQYFTQVFVSMNNSSTAGAAVSTSTKIDTPQSNQVKSSAFPVASTSTNSQTQQQVLPTQKTQTPVSSSAKR